VSSLSIKRVTIRMKSEKAIVRWGQGLLIVNAAIWVGVGVAWLLRHDGAMALPPWLVWGLGLAMLSYGALLLAVGIQLRLKKRRIHLAAVLLISMAIIGGMFDDLGLADLLGMLPALAALIYLWIHKNTFSGAGPAPKGADHDAIGANQGERA